ncbi:SpoVR family protein [Sporotomaculum syntrophicum]|uniref:SpoVR family protein n=1 Tax=Sporotomaculum syntrophicum TaxID=182264 RepID=A0A9D3AX17_9FIRM|nr:SpoVR family protein [Sporotomaculum syntrophicum]KAF1084537.1 SpoVR family protein [Sporotomaculum syntrophicum]
MHPQEEMKILEKSIEDITAVAKKFNLDFYNMYFEICPAEIIYSFGSYGMPTRFSHWTFGKAYHKMKTQYDYNLSRIYEMVINTDPCYAFLLEGNSLVQNKMVIAHVLAHSDFFKNNYYFSRTSRKMVESMSLAADRIRGYEFKYGRDKVESFLDAVIALQENIDPERHINPGGVQDKKDRTKEQTHLGRNCSGGKCRQGKEETPYDDLWDLERSECDSTCAEAEDEGKKIPGQPEKDLLLFMMNYARDLDDWQRDILSILREEMLYFWPQMQTKIMNEGWATYWHMRIMREMDLTEDEALEFAKTHAGVVQTSKYQLNPYYLGLKIFENIEKRWDHPTTEERKIYERPGGQGKQKIFEVRETENDVSFIRNYLTRELIEENDLYLFKKIGYDWKVTDKDWEKVRDGLVANLYNCGLPYIVVEDGDFVKQGELYLRHVHEGEDLDIYYLERTLPHVHKIWGRKVHLETVVDGKKILFTYNGDKVYKKTI